MKKPIYKRYGLLLTTLVIMVLVVIGISNLRKEPSTPTLSGVAVFGSREEVTTIKKQDYTVKDITRIHKNYDTSSNDTFYYAVQVKNMGTYEVDNVDIAIDGLNQKYKVGTHLDEGTVEWIDDLNIIIVPFKFDDSPPRDLYVVTKIEYNDGSETKEVYIDPQIVNKIEVFKSLYKPIVNEIVVSRETNKYIIKFYMDEPTEYTGIIKYFDLGNTTFTAKTNKENIYTFDLPKYPDSQSRFGYTYWNGRDSIFVDMGPLPYPEGYSYKVLSIDDIKNFDPSNVKPLTIDAEEWFINDDEPFYVIEVMNDIVIPDNITFSHTVDHPIFFVRGNKDVNLILKSQCVFFNPNGKELETNMVDSGLFIKDY